MRVAENAQLLRSYLPVAVSEDKFKALEKVVRITLITTKSISQFTR